MNSRHHGLLRGLRAWSVICSAIAALLVPGAAHALQDCTLDGAAVNPNNGATTQGKSGIMRCVERDGGVLMRERELRDGKFVGLERIYQNGKLFKEHSINERGNKQGRAREFSPSGQVLRDDTYDNGEPVALARQYFENGQRRRVTFYAPAQGEQAYAEFNPSGQLSELRCASAPRLAPDVDDARLCGFNGVSELELFSDKRVLRARLRLDGGKRLRQETLYDNGVPQRVTQLQGKQRIEQSFSPSGVKLREERFAVSEQRSVLELEQRYSETGKLTQEKRWLGGEPTSERSFYLNGQLQQETLFSVEQGVHQQQLSQYHDNGKLASVGRSLRDSRHRDVPVGVHKRYDEQGQLRSESSYDEKGHLNRERSWDGQAKLERDDEVFEDGSRKAFAK
jgi:antitoxin component YwqK of YwqJK toxin-antitoxin module